MKTEPTSGLLLSLRVAVADEGIMALDHDIAKGEPNEAAETIKLTSKFLVDEGT
jgi:hypothetical protein